MSKLRNGFIGYVNKYKDPEKAFGVVVALENNSGDLFKSMINNNLDILKDYSLYINNDEFYYIIPENPIVGLGGRESIENNQCAFFYLPEIKRERDTKEVLFSMDGMKFH